MLLAFVMFRKEHQKELEEIIMMSTLVTTTAAVNTTTAVIAQTVAHETEVEEAYKTLCLAILKQAANDYILASKYLSEYTDDGSEEYAEMAFLKRDAESFFKEEELRKNDIPVFGMYYQGRIKGEVFLHRLNKYIERNGYVPVRIGNFAAGSLASKARA